MPRGGNSRRAKNRRYRHNRQERSRLLLASWNAEGVASKISELSRWLSDTKVDVVALQEAQLAGGALTVPGYQTAVISRRARGRRGVGPVRGGDVAILARNGLNFQTIRESPLQPEDDSTEWCAIRVMLSTPRPKHQPRQHLDVYNIYRPPIRTSTADQRVDHFSLEDFPTLDNTVILGDINGHHPAWDVNCYNPDGVGQHVYDWACEKNWQVLNTGEPTRNGYGEEAHFSAPDVALAHSDLARRCTWQVGADLGSDHMPMVITASIAGSRPRRIRKERWAFHKADWTGFAATCEVAAGAMLQEDSVERLATALSGAICGASAKHIPRGARADPQPWALDEELVQAVEERRAARRAVQEDPSRENQALWKEKKRKAADVEEEARRRSFRNFASTELNRPAALGRVTKLLRKMEGAVLDACPGQAVSGDRGQLVAEDRSKAEAFVRTYAGVSRHTRNRARDRAVKSALKGARATPCACEGRRTDHCKPFTRQEMLDQMKKMKCKKAPGTDGVCTEHLLHLGPLAQDAMLRLFNMSWHSTEVPSLWRRAVIIPIPKAGKDPQDVTSYRPISLTSHVAKLMERMVAARVTHLLDRDSSIPAEQVGFRRGRSAEENLGRLIQEVQDGWNRPAPRGRPVDGKTAARFILTAYDFSRAYDVIDHQMLRLKMLQRLPRCHATWIFHFLRDRRACAEVNGVRSSSRPFRAGLPQGSVLAPTLFTLWSADLVEELRKVPGTSTFMYADDTATLSSGATIEQAKDRAQRAADVMAAWARRWKMRLAGSKTQVLALSQRHDDARDLEIKVDGASVKGTRHLHLLGVTFDRLLHFGEHCSRLRRKTKPRVAQMRKMTARSWGLQEPQLRTIANGYVRGALEYAAAAWLPAASDSHVELLEREMRAAARVITGCPISKPVDPLMAEAGLVPVRTRREVLAARLVCTAESQGADDPLRATATKTAPRRLQTTGWRDLGREALARVGLHGTPVEERLHVTLPPWTESPGVSFRMDIGAPISREAHGDVRRAAAERHLATLPDQATWIWSDGSAEGGVASGGGGALITLPSGEESTVRTPAGAVCSSTRAELVAIRAALEEMQRLDSTPNATPLVVCTDSQAALATLASGAGAQRTALGAAIWRLLLVAPDRPIQLQWVPAHCGLPPNERADELAKEASSLPQADVPVDVRSATKAVARAASKAWRERWPDSLFKRIMGDRFPKPVLLQQRDDAVNVHQMRAGHWGLSACYLHRIGRLPTPACRQCDKHDCKAAYCRVCREERDTPEHVLLRCPCLAGTRLRLFGTIHPEATRLRGGGDVAALARGYLRHRESLGYGRP